MLMILFDIVIAIGIIKYVGVSKVMLFSSGWFIGVLISAYFLVTRADDDDLKRWKREYRKRSGIINWYKVMPVVLLLMTSMMSLKMMDSTVQVLSTGIMMAWISCLYMIKDCAEMMHMMMIVTEYFYKMAEEKMRKG